jgi:acetyl esterase/lipase
VNVPKAGYHIGDLCANYIVAFRVRDFGGNLLKQWARDDPSVLTAVVKFDDALKSAGHSPEVHIFSAGGHGFGMRKQDTGTDHWIDEFYYWLEAQGFARPTARQEFKAPWSRRDGERTEGA